MSIDLTQVLVAVLGGGLVATVTAFFNGFKSLKEGARTREKSTIEDLVAQRIAAVGERDEANDQKDWALSDRDRWKGYAGDLLFLARQNGLADQIPPMPPEPPRD